MNRIRIGISGSPSNDRRVRNGEYGIVDCAEGGGSVDGGGGGDIGRCWYWKTDKNMREF